MQCLNVNFRDKFFLADGTLLGHVRDGGFIVGDHDMDIGMWADDFDERILTDILAAGFILNRTYGNIETGVLYMFSDGNVLVDLMFYHRSATHIWTDIYSHNKTLRASFAEFELEPANFNGIDVMVPSPPEQYLADVYGPTWKTPVLNWSYKYSAHNLTAVGSIFWRGIYPLKRAWWRWRNPEIYG